MRRSGIGVGLLVVVGSVAAACGGDDGKRKVYESDAGAGGAGEAGAGDARSGAPGTPEGGSAGTAGTELVGGAAGSSPSEGLGGGSGGESAAGGSPGNFSPAAPRLALGGVHSCALALDDSVACWGRGDHGELGDGAFYVDAPTGVAAPVAVTGLAGVAALTSGLYHMCALLAADDSVVCWGGGNDGQLGDDVFHTNGDGGVAAPQAVALEGVLQITAGGNHTCALLSGGAVQCWGDNLFGQLGDGSQTKSATPLAVPGLSGVQQLASGKFQTCALMADSSVKCWGSGGVNAQAGSAIYLLEPTTIDGVTGATALSAGDDFTCALVTGGKVQCWGEGDVGQLGDGNENDSNTTPVTVPGLSGIVQLSAGGRHVCALGADQALRCWGDGQYGQLGDGVFHNGFPYYVTQPVPAELLTDVVEVACGETHTCVRNGQDQIVCVGSGSYGQLGDGVFHSASPFGSAKPVAAFDL